MKRYVPAAILWIVSMFLLSACGSRGEEAEQLQRVTLEEVEVLEIDHGSTTLFMETADVEALEVSLLRGANSPGAVVDQDDHRVKIRLDNDITRMLNIGRMPQLRVRIPADYAGKVIVDGSSGNVTGTGLQNHSLQVKGRSGNISLAFTRLNNDVEVSATSGNVNIQLDEETPGATWMLQSGSGHRSIAVPLEDRKESNRKTEGRSGAGQHEVKLKTSSGNISIK
ncbi:DUF4097 family beta strand repeat-containing protein [Paenibacillus sp. ISL-20]|uniref:DUF4097 family beta strand repeat-containing protein n=1 Tax=Paenibacillus sp. ISL-20 TaxID=2819163 RepID=UPI001BE9EB2D|nr:DUF4097 family beta strand repeat-containing protein [Paenibacillus sp. ISL-20]MBT2765456.1 DUF4097 family beta strand repeat protein [Paenibacillus sp. ISL-20]